MMISTSSNVIGQPIQTVATPNQLIDALHTAFGKHPGARAVHAKGITLEGNFSPTAEASNLTTALHL